MEQRISIRGRTARKMVKMANHMPYLGHKAQTGELRAKISEREKLWECPNHLEQSVIDMGLFKMELLKLKDVEEKKGVILQLHGGGYYGKLHNTYREMAGLYNELSKGYDVLSADYRVAPDNPYPAALEDALAAYNWILENKDNIDVAYLNRPQIMRIYKLNKNATFSKGNFNTISFNDFNHSGSQEKKPNEDNSKKLYGTNIKNSSTIK